MNSLFRSSGNFPKKLSFSTAFPTVLCPKSAENDEIPCSFPVYQGIYRREWFATDCVIRQAVRDDADSRAAAARAFSAAMSEIGTSVWVLRDPKDTECGII
jgi:hypothetical protein